MSSGVERSRITGTSLQSLIRWRWRGRSSTAMASQSTCPWRRCSRGCRCWSMTWTSISAQRSTMRGPPILGNSVFKQWPSAVCRFFCFKGENFLRRKSVGRLAKGGPSFSPPMRCSQPHELFEVIGEVALLFAVGEQFQIALDQGRSPTQEKGDLAGFHTAPGQLSTAHKGRQIVGDGGWRVTRDRADLAGGFPL